MRIGFCLLIILNMLSFMPKLVHSWLILFPPNVVFTEVVIRFFSIRQ